METVKLGQITAPVGIKGEVRVFPYVDRISRFSDIKSVFVGEELAEYTIEKYRPDKNMIVIKFKEVEDRNTSEGLRNKNIYCNRRLYKLEKDAFFLDDLIGCSVVSEQGEALGVLNKVIQNTAQDIYEVMRENGKSFLIPAVKEFIKNVDIKNKSITVHLIEGMVD